MVEAFAAIKALGCRIESGKIARLVPAQAPDVGVTVILDSGKEVKMGWVAHKPYTALASKEMITSLGIEVDSHPLMGESIKADMFGATPVKGAFVAGDASTPMKAVVNALSSGMLPIRDSYA